LLIADLYYNNKKYEKSKQEYEVLFRNWPANELVEKAKGYIGEINDLLAYRLYEKGEKWFLQGQDKEDEKYYHKAIPIFIQVGEEYPETDIAAGGFCNLGACYELLHEWKKAVDTYDLVLKRYSKKTGKAFKDAVGFAEDHKNWIEANRL